LSAARQPPTLLRGHAYAATLHPEIGEKCYVVVSNNQRNRHLPSALAVRLTTSPKPALDSVVETARDDPVHGRALCDDIVELWRDEVRTDLGVMSPLTMRRIGDGLRAALAL
jgi:mRNA interferase MazF